MGNAYEQVLMNPIKKNKSLVVGNAFIITDLLYMNKHAAAYGSLLLWKLRNGWLDTLEWWMASYLKMK